MDLANLTAAQILNRLDARDVSAVECVTHFLNRIDILDPHLNAFVTTTELSALEQAERIDKKREANKLGNMPLAGLPIAIKDNICTSQIKTTAGSKMLADHIPFYDATVVELLKQAGAIVIGKTMLDEFAMGSSTENPHFGSSKNPWANDRVAGGSSGGSAVAVASRIAPIALGSDTGGSVRQPAAFCGVTGLKPTYGRVSRYGSIAYGSSLDQVGPITQTAEDAALILDVIAGHDPKDSTSLTNPTEGYSKNLPLDFSRFDRPPKIGICREHFDSGLDPQIRESIEGCIRLYKELGAEVVEISLPHSRYSVEAYYLVASCEASSNLSRYDGAHYTQRRTNACLTEMYEKTRSECFGEEVQNRILLGTFSLCAGYSDQYYVRASKVRRLIRNDFDDVFAHQADFILGPTTPTTAFKLGEKTHDPIAMYLGDVYTVAANLAGIPAISIPCGQTEDGLPIGMQLQTRHLNESGLLAMAHAFQQTTDWHKRSPAL